MKACLQRELCKLFYIPVFVAVKNDAKIGSRIAFDTHTYCASKGAVNLLAENKIGGNIVQHRWLGVWC